MTSERDALKDAVVQYLRFSRNHAALADEIAGEVAGTLVRARQNPSGRFGRLSLQRQIELETRSCIRHAHTGYDEVVIENTLEQADLTRGAAEAAESAHAADEVTEFIARHRLD